MRILLLTFLTACGSDPALSTMTPSDALSKALIGLDSCGERHDDVITLEVNDTVLCAAFIKEGVITISVNGWKNCGVEPVEVMIHELLHMNGYQHGPQMENRIEECAKGAL